MADESLNNIFEVAELKKLQFVALMEETETLIDLWAAAYADYFVTRNWFCAYFYYLLHLRYSEGPYIVKTVDYIFHFHISLHDCIEAMRSFGVELLIDMENLLELLYSRGDANATLLWMNCITDIQRNQYCLKTAFPKFRRKFDCFRNLAMIIENNFIIPFPTGVRIY
ncbi:hypothetical protein AVEN_2601-1 [Araneus ventricosus]|uniref:Uncharacterized protein n=1 Tax=Araneus ventricosus TaxID=182803 RepID=A0A4Y2NL54_ARAVE|nr:hypothetical protein AVEN_2601-1 [Araneus ventricosus]